MSLTSTQSTILRRDSRVAFFENVDGGLGSSPLSAHVTDRTSTGINLPSGWAGAIPRPVQATGTATGTGVPLHRSIRFYEHTITPVRWDNTIDIKLAPYEDMRDSGIASITNIGGRIGSTNALHQLFRAQQVLMLGNGTTIATGYDGNAFFADSHETGTTGDNNLTTNITTSNNPTVAEFEAAVGAIIDAALGYTDDQGKVYDHDINNFEFMVPTNMTGVAAQVLSPSGTIGGSTVSTVGTRTDSAMTTGRFRSYPWFANGDMSNDDRFVGLRRPRNGNAGALIANQRIPVDLLMLDRNSPSDHAIAEDVVWFTTRGRWDIGYGDWRAGTLMVFT